MEDKKETKKTVKAKKLSRQVMKTRFDELDELFKKNGDFKVLGNHDDAIS